MDMDTNKKYKHSDRYIRLGLNIAYYRKLKGITQMELAEKVNASRTHISNIEAPYMPVSVSLYKLFDIEDVLDVSVDRLFDFKV